MTIHKYQAPVHLHLHKTKKYDITYHIHFIIRRCINILQSGDSLCLSVLDGFMSDRAELNLLQATGGGILNIKSEMTTVYFGIREREREIAVMEMVSQTD